MQDLAIKKDLFLQDPARFKAFSCKNSFAIKKDLFWHNLAGSCMITLSGHHEVIIVILEGLKNPKHGVS